MKVDLDMFEMLYLLEGVSIGSHLRQHIWKRAVDEWYKDMDPKYAETVFTYSRRDISPKYEPRMMSGSEYKPFGAEDFKTFLAAFNPANRYIVTAKCGDNIEKDTPCFMYDGKYHVKMDTWICEKYITEVKHLQYERCMNHLCGKKDKCARYTDNENMVDKSSPFSTVYSQKDGCDFILDIDVLESYKQPKDSKTSQSSQSDSQDS